MGNNNSLPFFYSHTRGEKNRSKRTQCEDDDVPFR